MKELKPFDLEAAKRGDPICFDSGRPAEYIGMHPKANQPVIWAEDFGVTYTHPERLRMAPKKRTVFLNLGEDGLWHEHESKAIAERAAERLMYEGKKYRAIAVPVEIEE